jgi:hypothetical protein
MANIDGLLGFNPSTGSAILFAAYGNDIVNVSTGLGYSSNITAGNKGEFASFLDNAFYQNGVDGTRRFNGTKWINETLARKSPISKYISLSPRNRLLFGYVTYNSLTFASRVWFTDLPKNNNVTYGLEYGSDLSQIAGSKVITSASASFETKNIKVGDPFLITTGTNAGEYIIASVDSGTQITLTDSLINTASNSSYWTGSNWFDAQTNDSDVITGLGQNSDRDLIFKLMSLFRYDGTSLRKLKDAVGTSSHRSIINHKGTTYYFHGSDPKISGIYATDGITSVKISKPIEPFILGMSTSNYTEIVAWKEGEELRFYLGDLTNTNENISMTNAVATLDTTTDSWDVSPIKDVIKVATTFRTNNRLDWFTGTSDSQVLQMGDGNSFNTAPITLIAETKVIYPAGSEVVNEIPYIQIISKNCKGIKVKYKLWDHPATVDDQYNGMGEITDDRTEFVLPIRHNQAAGIQIRFEESGILENDAFIEKISIFYRPDRTRFI